MNGWKRFWGFLAGKYRLLAEKKYTTLAGTLVFFLLMSLVPMLFWGTLLMGKLHVRAPNALSLPGMEQVGDLLDYISKEAQSATSGASVFLLITSLYSATNLFYQMRKSGEIIYGTPSVGKGIQTRLSAVALLFLVMALIVLTVLAFAAFSFFLTRLVGEGWEKLMEYLLLAVLAFFLVFFLNLFICPYPASPRCFLVGSLLTVAAWAVSIAGFGLYLRIGNMGRLYGALSAVIVFLLWLYVLTVCFVSGVILNSEQVEKQRRTMPRRKRR